MAFKILCVSAVFLSFASNILSTYYGLFRARKAHGTTLKDVKNEVPGGYALRGALSLLYYFAIVDWIGGWRSLPWVYLQYPRWIQAAGIGLLSLTAALFWWVAFSIGSNYHGPMKLHERHELVTTGPYALIRHPMYLAFLLMHASYFLITRNLLLLASGMAMSLYVNGKRIVVEERSLKERFGKDYAAYEKRTGRYFPRIFRRVKGR